MNIGATGSIGTTGAIGSTSATGAIGAIDATGAVMPRFWPRYIKCTWCIYCNDHGVELKAKAPPLIGNAMFWILNRHRLYIGACGIYYDGHHVKYASIIKISTTSYGRGNQIEWGMIS